MYGDFGKIALIAGIVVIVILVFSFPVVVSDGCNEDSTKVMAICKVQRVSSCYVWCQDYTFKCIEKEWLPIGADQIAVCHDKGWVDPRTGVVYE